MSGATPRPTPARTGPAAPPRMLSSALDGGSRDQARYA